MKSYIQGLITGGVLVFASIIFMGQSEFYTKGKIGTFIPFHSKQHDNDMIINTMTGQLWDLNVLAYDKKNKSYLTIWRKEGINLTGSVEAVNKAIENDGEAVIMNYLKYQRNPSTLWKD